MTSPAEDFSHSEDDIIKHYSDIYLKHYWPEHPSDPIAWADNAVLMLAYQEAAIAMKSAFQGSKVKALDISTGPALAPLLCMIDLISEVQLSDYHAVNRLAAQHMPIEYWRNYVPMLVKILERPDLLSEEPLKTLDSLRSQHTPLPVDLFSEAPFGKTFDVSKFNLVTLNFVADGITKTEEDFFKVFTKVINLTRPGSGFIMSSVVDTSYWLLGNTKQPSPNVSEETILGFLKSQNFKILNLSRSMRMPGLHYNGGWIVLSALREK